MKNNQIESDNTPNTIESSQPQAQIPSPAKKSFWHETIKETPPFSLFNWISQVLFVVVPSIAIIPLYLLMLFKQRTELSGLPLLLLGAVVVFSLCSLGYSVWQIVKKRGAHKAFSMAISFLYFAWIALNTFNYRLLDMKSDDPILLISALAILPVFYSMVNIIKWLTTSDTKTTFAKSTVTLILIPLVWYLMVNTVMNALSGTLGIIALILTIVATYFFIFLLFKILYLIGTKLPSVWKITKFILLFIMPILCFVVTQIGDTFSFFWNYTSPIYYLLIIINGVLILAPEPKKKWQQILLFLAKSSFYLIVTYFFVVIAPFYSFSLIGLLFSGIGLLVLTPLFLWAYQTRLLINSAKALFKDYGGVTTISTAVVGVLLVPVLMIGSFVVERYNFSKALTHMNNLGVQSESIKINSRILEKTFKFISADQRLNLPSSQSFIGGYEQSYRDRTPPPFITELHNKVLDIESFSAQIAGIDESLGDMYRLYINIPVVNVEEEEYYSQEYDDEYEELIPDEWIDGPESQMDLPTIKITGVTVDTKKEQDYYRSFVNLTIKNGTEYDLQEYQTEIELPEGVFVSDYYLDVLGERKFGLLSETTSANWIYNEVTSRFLDPGILNYTQKGLSMKVFPFSAGETRYTGIEFLHNEPITLMIDEQEVKLAEKAPKVTNPILGDGVIFISETSKNNLTPSTREPYYVFAVDCSYESDVEKLVKRIDDFVIKENIPASHANISAINYNRQTWSMEEAWKEPLLQFPRIGGFGYGLMARNIFSEIDNDRFYPVLIVVENTSDEGLKPTDTEYLLTRTPETGAYYSLRENNILVKSFTRLPDTLVEQLPDPVETKKLVVAGESYYILADTGAEILYKNNLEKTVSDYSENKWLNALNFKGDKYRISMLPDEEEAFEAMLTVIKQSFTSDVMSPYTSFIVLELPAQEEAMLSRQKILLESASWDDFHKKMTTDFFKEEEPNPDQASTSEPSLIISLALLLPMLVVYRKRKRRESLNS